MLSHELTVYFFVFLFITENLVCDPYYQKNKELIYFWVLYLHKALTVLVGAESAVRRLSELKLPLCGKLDILHRIGVKYATLLDAAVYPS